MAEKVIYTVGYGMMEGSHTERKEKFQKRLLDIQRKIGKPITLIDIRRKNSGSHNGFWFTQYGGLEALVMNMQRGDIEVKPEPNLANKRGDTLRELVKYRNELWFNLGPGAYEKDVAYAFNRVRVASISQNEARAVVLLCGCRDAYKPNGTTWNCHRAPLADVLVEQLGEGWEVVHL
jgi:hypothetical protein